MSEQISSGETLKNIARSLVFIELKPEVAERLELPANVPVLQQDLVSEIGKGQLPPEVLAAGIEAFKILKPDDHSFDRFLARYFLLEGQRALEKRPLDEYQAHRYFQMALDLNVGDLSAEGAYYLGTLVAEVDINEAEEYYSRSLELNPDAPSTYFELGKLLREKRDLSGALEAFEKAYRLDPESLNLLNEIGDTQLMASAPDKARAAFARAYELEPEYWIFPIKLGTVEFELQEYASAIKHLRAGLENAPEELEGGADQGFYIEGLYTLGMAYRMLGDNGRARKLFRSILEMYPDHQGALEALSHG